MFSVPTMLTLYLIRRFWKARRLNPPRPALD